MEVKTSPQHPLKVGLASDIEPLMRDIAKKEGRSIANLANHLLRTSLARDLAAQPQPRI